MSARPVVRTAAVGAGLLMVVGLATPALASSGRLSQSQLKALANRVSQSKKLTFEATYRTLGLGNNETVVIAQAPPKSLLSIASGLVVDTGTKTYYCTSNGGNDSCVAAGTADPFLGIEEIFSPAATLAAFAQAKEGLVSRSLGIKTIESSATIAGQASTCITVTVKGTADRYCVTKQGVLSYSGSRGDYFELTKYSASPRASLFRLPAGSYVAPLPTGPVP